MLALARLGCRSPRRRRASSPSPTSRPTGSWTRPQQGENYVAPAVRFRLKNVSGQDDRLGAGPRALPRPRPGRGALGLDPGAGEHLAEAAARRARTRSSPCAPPAATTRRPTRRHILRSPAFKDPRVEVYVRIGSSSWAKLGEAPVERRIGAPGALRAGRSPEPAAQPPARRPALRAPFCGLPGLGYPREEYFDEVYHAKTALQYLRGEPPTEWVHPPTAKLLIAVGVCFFGYQPWAWRLAPALAGTLLAGVFFLLARRVLATERAALLATGLLLLDGVYLVQSRIAMTNVFAVLFQLLSALLVRARGRRAAAAARGRWRPPASRSASRSRRAGRASGPGASSASCSSRCGRAAARAPPDIDAPAQGPLGASGSSRSRSCAARGGLPAELRAVDAPGPRGAVMERRARVAAASIWGYHANLRASHTYFSRVVDVAAGSTGRPGTSGSSGEGFVRGIVALGNPAIWWASVPASLWALVHGIRSRAPAARLRGRGLLPPLSAVGRSRRARSTSATTSSRRSRTRASRSASSSTASGTARSGALAAGATSRPSRCSSCSSCPS